MEGRDRLGVEKLVCRDVEERDSFGMDKGEGFRERGGDDLGVE